jgi:hypothetical protein
LELKKIIEHLNLKIEELKIDQEKIVSLHKTEIHALKKEVIELKLESEKVDLTLTSFKRI